MLLEVAVMAGVAGREGEVAWQIAQFANNNNKK